MSVPTRDQLAAALDVARGVSLLDKGPAFLEALRQAAADTETAVGDPATLVRTDDTRLGNARTPTAHTHPAAQISDATTTGRAVVTAATQDAARTAIGAQPAGSYASTVHQHPAADVTGLATVATTGSYTDLTDKPATTGSTTVADATATTKGVVQLAGDLSGTATAPTVPALADKANTADLATVATTGLIADITDWDPQTVIYSTGLATATDANGALVVTAEAAVDVTALTAEVADLRATVETLIDLAVTSTDIDRIVTITQGNYDTALAAGTLDERVEYKIVAAPAVVLSSTTTQATPTNQELNTFTHTTVEESGRALVAVSTGIPFTTVDPGVTVTWGGATMTLVTGAQSTGGTTSGHNRGTRLFTLANPPTGAAEVVVRVPPNGAVFASHAATALTVVGASTLGTPASTATTDAATTTQQVTTQSAAGGVVLAVAAGRNTTPPTAPDTQTVLTSSLAGTNTGHLLTGQPSGAGATSTATLATAGQLALIAVPILPVAP